MMKSPLSVLVVIVLCRARLIFARRVTPISPSTW